MLAAYDQVGFTVPLVVRLEGTNAQVGRDRLDQSGLSIITAVDLSDAAVKVVKASEGKS